MSIGTFLFAGAVSAWIAKRQPALAVTLVAIALMQLVEYVIWMDQGCGTANKLATAAIRPVLALQPLLIALAIWWFGAGMAPRWLYMVVAILLAPTLGRFLWNAYQEYGHCTRPGKDGRLAWRGIPWKSFRFSDLSMYYPTMGVLIGTMRPAVVTWPLLALYGLTYHMSSGPSVWCHAVNLTAAWALVAV